MKRIILLFALSLITIAEDYGPEKIFTLKSDGSGIIDFDEDSQYLKINIESFKTQQPEKTTFVQRLFGRDANLILGTVELKANGEKMAFPVFKFKRTTNDVYTYESIGVDAGYFNKVVQNRIIYNDGNPPVLTFSIKKWVEDKDVSLIEGILNSLSSLNIIGTEAVEQSQILNNVLVDIIKTVKPADDNYQSIDIQLNKSNIKNKTFSIYYKEELIKPEDGFSIEPLITFSLESENAFLRDNSLVDYMQKFPDKGLTIFEDAIHDADQEINKSGKQSVMTLFRGLEDYVSNLDLTILDKKLFVAKAFAEWPTNGISGFIYNGKNDKLDIRDYQSLKLDDFKNINQYIDHSLFNVEACIETNRNCNSPECHSLAYYMSLSFVSSPDELKESLTCLLAPYINFSFGDLYNDALTPDEFIDIFRPLSYTGFDSQEYVGMNGKKFLINKDHFKFLYNGTMYKANASFKLMRKGSEAVLQEIIITDYEEA